jgi:hypothetical protein
LTSPRDATTDHCQDGHWSMQSTPCWDGVKSIDHWRDGYWSMQSTPQI